MLRKYSIALLTCSALALSISPAWGKSKIASKITFACENNHNIPITVAKNNQGKTQTIFYWQWKVLKISNSKTHKLCNSIANKLNNRATKNPNLSSLR
jgi:hypothetical protein